MGLIRFNIDKGRLIYSEQGSYLYKATHQKVIDKLHETFDLKNIKIKEPVCFCMIHRKDRYILVNNKVLNSIETEVLHDNLVEYSEHKNIIDGLEKTLFN